MPPSSPADLAHALTSAFLGGEWSVDGMLARADLSLTARPPWLRACIRRTLAAYPHPPADRPRELRRFLLTTLPVSGPRTGVGVHRWLTAEPAMAFRRWPVPDIATVGDLAELLEMTPAHLTWLADAHSLERLVTDERLRNYAYAALTRRRGPVRVIERPKHRLKTAQRCVLREILETIPLHDAAHGFTRSRSAVTHARLHTNRAVVVRVDLRDFFASVSAGRVFGIFRAAGYPESLSHCLAALCTNVVSRRFWHTLPRPTDSRTIPLHHRLGRQLAVPHLPQGAPTSPALANLAAYGLDRRLSGLAAKLGATYSRYADDLVFSGDRGLVRAAPSLRARITHIAREEGFTVNESKSTLATRAARQRVCGVVVNEHPNVERDEYDLLKATLHNAARDGPASQNRTGVSDFRAHLLGRIAWVASLNPSRGERLLAVFRRIDWSP